MLNGISCLKLSAFKYPEKIGFICDDESYTYEQVANISLVVAEYLRDVGIGRGDKICSVFYNSIELIIAWFSTLIVGAIIVPINFIFVADEMSYIAEHSEVKAILYGSDFEQVVNVVRNQVQNLQTTFLMDINDSKLKEMWGQDRTQKFEEIDEGIKDAKDISFINYTSGTTGKPKGAMITHQNSIWNQVKISQDTPLIHEDVFLSSTPLFHSGGMGRFLATVLMGGTFVTWRNFSAIRTMESIGKYKATNIALLPSMTRMIMELPNINEFDVETVRIVLLFAANVPVEMKKNALKIFYNAKVIDCYGMTENTSATTMLKGDDVLRKPSSVGLPYMFTRIKIFDDEFNELPPETVGEIGIKGPTVMKGYFKNQQATDETIKDGWLLSGDLGKKDKDGYLYIMGRKKEMIISGGENIYPTELELILINHPKIREAAIVGTSHPKWGETVVAFIVIENGEKMTEEEFDNFCIEKMARYKRPRIVKFVNTLFRNENGKVVKKELKKIYGLT